MNIFNHVTRRTLLKNKTRTVVTIIGIILSAAMLCAVISSVTSLMDFGKRNVICTSGDWYANVLHSDSETLEKVKTEPRISSYVTANNLGYAPAEGCQNPNKPFIYVQSAEKSFFETMPVRITSGRLPENSGEIVLPEHLMTNGGVVHSLGDTLTLSIGDRFFAGENLHQNNPYPYEDSTNSGENETFSPRMKQTYTVVGFCSRPDFEVYSAPGYTAFTLEDSASASSGCSCDIYYKTTDVHDVYSVMTELGGFSDDNSSLLMFYGVSGMDSFYTVLYGFAAVLIVLVFFGSVSLIYNAFSISVSERTKQFGLLSSVGATKKQLRHAVFYEAMSVSVIGIPLGILAGLGGIGVTFRLLGSKFMSLGPEFAVPIRLCVSVPGIIATIVLALATVLISAWIPSKRATKVSAVEAVRQSSDITIRAKDVKSGKLAYRIFGLPGMLASKYYSRSRKKYRTTVFSLFMSIVLFVTATSMTSYLTSSVDAGFDTAGYDIGCELSLERGPDFITPAELKKEITSYAEVSECVYAASIYIDVHVEPEDCRDKNESDIVATLCFIDDESYRQYLSENGLDEERYMSTASPVGAVVDGMAFFSGEESAFVQKEILSHGECTVTANSYNAPDGYEIYRINKDENGDATYEFKNSTTGEMKVLTESEAIKQTPLALGKRITDKPFFVSGSGYLAIMYPYSLMDTILGSLSGITPPDEVSFAVKSDEHAKTAASLSASLTSNGAATSSIMDYRDMDEQNRNIVSIINVFAYGFIVLISLIAAANVFNTISTNISLRRRDFAMLRSVGITAKGMRRMMNCECLLYGSQALLFGLPVSLLSTLCIHLITRSVFQSAFVVPWKAMGIATLSVFIVVFSTMLYSMRKIKKENPIDALKNENI